MTASELFGPMTSSAEVRALVSDVAWVRAMLRAEAALAAACAAEGLVPADAAEAIAATCAAWEPDIRAIGLEAPAGANPVIPLVEGLTGAAPAEAREWVHFGATSQDILDTAMMLIARDVLVALVRDLTAAEAAAAALAREHRETVMAARTLLQQATPTTFGLKAAGWMTGLREARLGLQRIRSERLAAQLGGAAGTLAVYGDRGPAVARAFAAALDLPCPGLPWHTNRVRVGELASAVAIAAQACAKVALDVALLMQTELGEVREAGAPGRGRSSAMPQKRNPVLSTCIIAAARLTLGPASTILGAMAQEHERAAGAWQSEWQALTGLFLAASGATSTVADLLAGLEVDTERMRRNLELGGGAASGERIMAALAERIGRLAAQAAVRRAAAIARGQGMTLLEALSAEPEVIANLGREELAALFDPLGGTGAAALLVDAALAGRD